MAALLYLIDTLLSLAQLCFLLRLLLQWARADFRNPLSRAIVQLTNPVLVPLRRAAAGHRPARYRLGGGGHRPGAAAREHGRAC